MLCNVQLILLFDVYSILKLTKKSQLDDDDGGTTDQSGVCHDGSTTTEREIQTELHPIPFHKDESYVWNLWDVRRKAIMLVS